MTTQAAVPNPTVAEPLLTDQVEIVVPCADNERAEEIKNFTGWDIHLFCPKRFR